MKGLGHHFIVDLMLYTPEKGGRKEPITREGFGCPCRLDEMGETFADCRLYMHGQQISPGETKRVGIRFSYEPDVTLFRAAEKFYLWDGRNIGEASVVAP